MDKELKDIPLPDSRELYRLVTDHNNKYDETAIARRAHTDAEKNIPAADSSDPAPFEKQLQHEASILASKVATRYKKALEMLDAKIKAEQHFLEQHEDPSLLYQRNDFQYQKQHQNQSFQYAHLTY